MDGGPVPGSVEAARPLPVTRATEENAGKAGAVTGNGLAAEAVAASVPAISIAATAHGPEADMAAAVALGGIGATLPVVIPEAVGMGNGMDQQQGGVAYFGVGEGDGAEEVFPSLHVELGSVTVVSTAERLHELQARVGNLSPRGSASRQQERKGKDTMAELNLDPVLVTNST